MDPPDQEQRWEPSPIGPTDDLIGSGLERAADEDEEMREVQENERNTEDGRALERASARIQFEENMHSGQITHGHRST